ncbi:MAG TPA: 16S rRNA (cytidine(1402)-2'-O)-methyltransferase [Balneolaceae bacterium]|nr:16S rRNA (cytidine(1402)-2'-O)-methyltransferase [Balneolaceae bacterium]
MSTLYIVATPIGNLSDFTLRAAETLKSVSYIACEDTRTSSVLLQKYGIDKPLFSFHQHNEHQKVSHIMNLLSAGESVAIISDAGMPGISDPGFLATREAHKAGYRVTVIPGPDSVTTALVASGLPCDRFMFEGFLPPKKGRQTRIRAIAEAEHTSVILESPHKIIRFLEQFHAVAGDHRMICIAREMTKKFEEIDRGPLLEILEKWKKRKSVKGEIVVVAAGKDYSDEPKTVR